MDRLTNSIDYCQLHCDFGKSNECFFQDKSKCYEKNIYEKLREYENLEEQGLLLRLPCKSGDTLYAIGFNNNRPFVYESVVLSILITEKEIVFNVKVAEFEINSQLKQSMFGRTVFLTKAEAEQKLKEMESDWDGKVNLIFEERVSKRNTNV